MTEELIKKTADLTKEVSDYLNSLPTSGSSACAEAYVSFRKLEDAVDTLDKLMGVFKNTYSTQVLPKAFSDDGVKTITLATGSRITVSEIMRASISADRREEAYEWLRENNLDDLITETVNASSLSAAARSLLEDGLELDQNLFKVVVLPQVSLTNPK